MALVINGTRLLNTREAAEILGRSQRWVARLCERGDLHGQKAGRAWLVAEKAVRQYTANPVGRPKFSCDNPLS